MLLAIDAGNTNIVFAIFDNDKVIGRWRLATDSKRTADEYAVWLLQIMHINNIAKESIDNAIISTVVPRALFDLRMLCRNYFSCDAVVIGESSVDVGMVINIDRPSELGSDRIVNAVAAQSIYGNSLIIIDFGTATTFDIVNEKGEYAGGIIAPGINLSLEALHMAAAKLPNVAIEKPKKVVGKSTVTAMQSGVYFGYLGLIEGIVARIKNELGKPMQVIATGGLANLFAKASDSINHLNSELTIIGLKKIFDINNKK